jgi:chemotaxis protein methyltransferase CheR
MRAKAAAVGAEGAVVDRAAALAQTIAGLRFDERTRDALAAALTRAARGIAGGAAGLVDAAAAGDEGARATLCRAATVGETYFFRHPEHFEVIRRMAPKLARAGSVQAWSAGCSTGEEAWSLAFALRDVVDAPSVVGSDLNASSLATARRGRYGRWSLRGAGLPAELRVTTATVEVPAPLRRLVRFVPLNLASDDWSATLGEARFDLVLCRNVLVYFEPSAAQAVMRKLAARLVEGGLLIVSALDVELAPPTVKPIVIDGVTVLVRRETAPPAAVTRPSATSSPARPVASPRHAADAARAAADRGDLAVALAAAEALVAETRAPEPLHLYALVLGELGRAAEAVALLQEAVTLDPAYVLGHLGLGLAHTLDGATRAQHLDRALALVDGVPDERILGGPDPLPASWVKRLASAAREGAR